MGKVYKKHSASLKTAVAVAAIKGQQTVNEIAAEHGVHPNQVTQWKKQLLDQAPSLFVHPATANNDDEELKARLYQEIGQLKVELDWVKKKSGLGR